jgi:uncharacterized protein YbjT (DUF2867 family)
MRIFVTGAGGFVCSTLIQELLDAGHQVVGLARSDAAAAKAAGLGAKVVRGELKDLNLSSTPTSRYPARRGRGPA